MVVYLFHMSLKVKPVVVSSAVKKIIRQCCCLVCMFVHVFLDFRQSCRPKPCLEVPLSVQRETHFRVMWNFLSAMASMFSCSAQKKGGNIYPTPMEKLQLRSSVSSLHRQQVRPKEPIHLCLHVCECRWSFFVLLSGITPLCYDLFALYDPRSCIWYSPNHIFTTENSTLVLHYCMRLIHFLFDTIQYEIKKYWHFDDRCVLFLHLDTIFGVGMKMSQLYPGILSNQGQNKKSYLYLMPDH